MAKNNGWAEVRASQFGWQVIINHFKGIYNRLSLIIYFTPNMDSHCAKSILYVKQKIPCQFLDIWFNKSVNS